MAAVVEAWMSELSKLKEKVGAKKRLVLSSKAEHAEQQQQEQREFKEARKENSCRMVQTQRDLDSSSRSEDTVCLLMDRFVPWCWKVIEQLQACCEKCTYNSTHCASVSGLLKQKPK